MIEVRSVSFKYDKKNYILYNIDLTFDTGLHLLKGPNGSGKTTLCKIISGILPPTEGRIYIEGVDIYGEAGDAILDKVIFVHDKPIVLNRSVYENIIFGGLIQKGRPIDANYLIKKFRLEDLLEKNAKELSAGYKQLVSLLRAFAVKPKYLILDEPISNLDEEFRDQILEYLINYSKDNTVIIATHTPYLDETASTITYLNNGRIKKRIERN